MEPLTVEEIETARSKVLLNAIELFEEADLLLSHGRFPRAYALAQFCCEELAKLPMLTRAAITLILGKEVDWKTLDRRLRSHIDKINLLHYQEALQHPMSLEYADEDTYNELSTTTPMLNNRKNASLYSGITESVFCMPSELITEAIASEHLDRAGERLERSHLLESLSVGQLQELFANPEVRAQLEATIEEIEGAAE
jgi:AbiV family abortive infection protein